MRTTQPRLGSGTPIRGGPGVLTLLGTILLGFGCQASPQEMGPATPEERVAAALASTCVSCHGPVGRSEVSETTDLAGLSEDFLSARLATFRTDAGSNHVMHQLLSGYTDDEIESLVSHFASQSAQEGPPR